MPKTPRAKIKTLEELKKTAANLKKNGKKVVQCHGVFDLLHPGHIRHFYAAKKYGDALIVTLTADRFAKKGPGRPIFNESLRTYALASLEVVDYVCVLHAPTAVEGIRAIRPSVYAKGPDYKKKSRDVTGKIYDEEKAVRSVRGRLVVTDDITFSSSRLINNYLEDYPKPTVKYLKGIAETYGAEHILARLRSLRKMRVLVIGDAIIDQYHYCTALGKSSKESLVVNQYVSEESFAGGGLATANHAAQLLKTVDFVTVLGDRNSFEPFIRRRLSSNLRPKFFYRKDSGTTVKRRFVSTDGNKKLFEICYMKDHYLAAGEEKKVYNYLKGRLRDYDCVIVSDFGHGLMTRRLRKLLSSRARFLALNVQTNSANRGFNLVTKYDRADYVCIDEAELRLAAHDRYSALPALIKKIYRRLRLKQMIVTRGPEGAIGYSAKEGLTRSPAFSYQIVDKVGAGDAFFSFTAPCLAAKMSQDLVNFVGNAVGSLAVQIVCNREPVRFPDLAKFITRLISF